MTISANQMQVKITSLVCQKPADLWIKQEEFYHIVWHTKCHNLVQAFNLGYIYKNDLNIIKNQNVNNFIKSPTNKKTGKTLGVVHEKKVVIKYTSIKN